MERDPWWRVEPIYSSVRAHCQQAIIPLSWVTVDEVMIAFRGRSVHIVKQKNKPINEGYKIWALGFEGYCYDWLFYSPINGSEGCNSKRPQRFNTLGPSILVLLTDTF